ncbi:ABC transporter ATP-binding protein [Saccharomonospora sp. NPDC046836]|uniref:ABC transporter ATP-binding protein n=1 Tax=Saccharomonospora sp. NPDC046836 TaxID=3156921 RepID=UPI0033C05B3A
MPEVAVRHLVKKFSSDNKVTTVLNDVSFTVADGEFFTLLGPSGCGKSTTLACVAGLERPDGGSVAVGDAVFADAEAGTFIPPEGRNLGMVFQSYALWPHMTVAGNLALPLKLRQLGKAQQRERIDSALDKVGLVHLRDRYPHQLSGGQQQRVALARALAYSPSVLLLDEPLSNLDAKLREQARAWLKRLQAETGITTIYVTHDQHEALALSDRIAVMSEGNMAQVGTPTEIYEKPAAPEVASFIGRCNFLPGVVQGAPAKGLLAVKLDCNGENVTVQSGLDLPHGAKATVAVRPEKLRILRADDEQPRHPHSVVHGRILRTAYIGARFEHEIAVGDLVLHADSDTPGTTDEVGLLLDPATCLIYPGETALPDEAAELATITS